MVQADDSNDTERVVSYTCNCCANECTYGGVCMWQSRSQVGEQQVERSEMDWSEKYQAYIEIINYVVNLAHRNGYKKFKKKVQDQLLLSSRLNLSEQTPTLQPGRHLRIHTDTSRKFAGHRHIVVLPILKS